MGRYDNQTPVIFRKWPEKEGGDVIALFPTIPGTTSPYTCSSYMSIGQHSSADPQGVIWATKPAKPSDYADLMDELVRIGYDDLKVYQKLSQDFLTEREIALGLIKPVRLPSTKTTKRRKSRKGGATGSQSKLSSVRRK